MVNIEVRIHYGAPTTRLDDENYQAQGLFYQNLSLARRFDLSELPEHESLTDEMPTEDMADQGQRPSGQLASQTIIPATNVPPMPIYVDDVEQATRFLQSQLVPTSTRKLPSSDIVTKVPDSVAKIVRTPPRVTTSQISIEPETDSSYMKTPVFSRSSKRKRHSSDSDIPRYRTRHLTLGSSSGERDQLELNREQVHDGDEAKFAHIAPSSKSDRGNVSDSLLPTSYSLSNISPALLKSTSSSLQRSNSAPASDLAHSSHSSLKEARAQAVADERSAGQENPHEVASHLPQVDRSPNVDTPSRSSKANLLEGTAGGGSKHVPSEEETQSETQSAAQSTNNSSMTRKLLTVPDTMDFLKSPQPPVRYEPFTTHVTDQLEFLANCADMKDVYQPVTIAREIHTWERGHWLLNISSWLSESQTSFWSFLESFITNGAAGHMVLCCRGRESSTENEGTVKLFCFGEVAKHMYLVLYTASHSKVRNMGLQWKDSAGNVIIQMR